MANMTSRRLIRTVLPLIVAAIVGGVALINDRQKPTPPRVESVNIQTSATPKGEAASVLEQLPVKGRAPKTGYRRTQFGGQWADVGTCDMREKILARDMTSVQYVSPSDCDVLSGTLNDPYTGKVIQFHRGPYTSSLVQIDHVVALSDAWQKGAQLLPAQTRAQLYNDPLNLLAVDGPTNQQKGDGDAATWLPPNKDFRCRYVARQISVKVKYQLWVTQAEHDAIVRILATCPGQQLPVVSN
jgi:hypothetical protein